MVTEFRQVQCGDRELIARFFESNRKGEITRHFHPFPLTSQTAYEIACTDHVDCYYLAFIGGEVVGLSMLRGWDQGYEIPSFGIVIDHRHHNRGIGQRMLEWTLAEARKLGAERVRLSVYKSNSAAYHLYRSRGFVEASTEAVTVGGEPDEKVIMFMSLS